MYINHPNRQNLIWLFDIYPWDFLLKGGVYSLCVLFLCQELFLLCHLGHAVQVIVCLWKTANACSHACWMIDDCWQNLLSFHITWHGHEQNIVENVRFYFLTIIQARLLLGLKCIFQGKITDSRANLRSDSERQREAYWALPRQTLGASVGVGVLLKRERITRKGRRSQLLFGHWQGRLDWTKTHLT